MHASIWRERKTDRLDKKFCAPQKCALVKKKNELLYFSSRHEVPLSQKEVEQNDVEKESESFYHPSMIDRLLERHKICIPHHEPKLYCAAAAKTRSVPGFNILAFPDFWGHVPPPGPELMAPRKLDIQRYMTID